MVDALPKVPAACADLDLALVERTLAKHFGDIPAAARELNISIPDLRRLTWAKPRLLEEAELECMGIVARAMGELIRALYSDDPPPAAMGGGADHVELAGARSPVRASPAWS